MQWQTLFSTRRLKNGRLRPPVDPNQLRSEFEKDFDRVTFSDAFRRLHDKTQVLPLPDSDFVHSRLTHSLETYSVGRSLGKIVGSRIVSSDLDRFIRQNIHPNDFADVVSAACLVHDIGNPPFGHCGEDAFRDFFANHLTGQVVINELRDDQLGADFLNFEGNAQGFRMMIRNPALQLTCATMSAFMKYPRESGFDPPEPVKVSHKKFGFYQSEKEAFQLIAGETGLPPEPLNGSTAYARHPLAFLVEAADDICYRIIDLEDGIHLNLIHLDNHDYDSEGKPIRIFDTLREIISAHPHGDFYRDDRYADLPTSVTKIAYLRGLAINSLVYQIAEAFMRNERDIINGNYPRSLIRDIPSYGSTKALLDITVENVYRCKPVLEIEVAGYEVINGLLDEFIRAFVLDDGTSKQRNIRRLIPEQFQPREGESLYAKVQRITDYIASMTDSYALSIYRKMKGIDIKRIY